MSNFDGNDDILDSREIIERLAELESDGTDDESGEIDLDRLTEEEREEYTALTKLNEDGQLEVSDWEYGEALIHSDYFTEYAQELLEEIGYIPADLPAWIVIDWEETADNLKEDYTELEFRGSTYYARR